MSQKKRFIPNPNKILKAIFCGLGSNSNNNFRNAIPIINCDRRSKTKCINGSMIVLIF